MNYMVSTYNDTLFTTVPPFSLLWQWWQRLLKALPMLCSGCRKYGSTSTKNTNGNRCAAAGSDFLKNTALLSLHGIIYVTWYTRHLPKPPESDSGSFRYARSRDYQTPTRHPVRSLKTNLLLDSGGIERHTSMGIFPLNIYFRVRDKLPNRVPG